MEHHIIKVFGERNTGTRAILRMLASIPNVKRRLAPKSEAIGDGAIIAAIESQMIGAWRRHYLHTLKDAACVLENLNDPWKHALPILSPAMIEAEVKTIFMVRNPYSWFLALARRPYHMKGPIALQLDEFAQRPWMTERRENMPVIVRAPMQLWNAKIVGYKSYSLRASQAKLPSKFIRFEDFVQDSLGCLSKVLSAFDVEAETVVALPQNTKREKMRPKQLAQYYGDEQWKSFLTKGLVQILNTQIDWEIALEFGYKQLDANDYPDEFSPETTDQIQQEMSGIRIALDRKAGAASAA